MAPKDDIERMLVTQMIGTHEAATECLRRAMIQWQGIEARDVNLKHAEKLMAVYIKQTEALNKHRGKGQQKITVKHVNVESGGQAIVGNVEAGKPASVSNEAAPALEQSGEMPMDFTPARKRSKLKRWPLIWPVLTNVKPHRCKTAYAVGPKRGLEPLVSPLLLREKTLPYAWRSKGFRCSDWE